MEKKEINDQPANQGFSTTGVSIMGSMPEPQACCGGGPSDPMTGYEKPGYKLMHYVAGFVETQAYPVPLIKTYWEKADTLSRKAVRALRSTTGVATVLVGMRREAYVKDVLTELQRPLEQKERQNSWARLQQSLEDVFSSFR